MASSQNLVFIGDSYIQVAGLYEYKASQFKKAIERFLQVLDSNDELEKHKLLFKGVVLDCTGGCCTVKSLRPTSTSRVLVLPPGCEQFAVRGVSDLKRALKCFVDQDLSVLLQLGGNDLLLDRSGTTLRVRVVPREKFHLSVVK